MLITTFHELGEIDDKQLDFAVICAEHKDQWIFVRHKQRRTWEIPGGHREEGEGVSECASRELTEETGATVFTLRPICDYGVTRGDRTTYGRLFFAQVEELGPLPNLEIAEVQLFGELPTELTYPEIQPYLHQRVESLLHGLISAGPQLKS